MSRSTPRVVVVGAGLAGLTAAVTASRAGADVVLLEARDEPGGASAESAGWIWRYGDLATFARCAPDGDPAVQRAVVEQLDDGLAWLRAQTGPPLRSGTGRSWTTGEQHDMPAVVDQLVRALPTGSLRTSTGLRSVAPGAGSGSRLVLTVQDATGAATDLTADRLVLAGGGFAAATGRVAELSGASVAASGRWHVRPRHGGDGSAQAAVRPLGAVVDPLGGSCFVRVVPDVPGTISDELLRAFGELTLPGTRLLDADGVALARHDEDWSGARGGWELARTTGGGWLELPAGVLDGSAHAGSVRATVAAARSAGAAATDLPGGAVRIAVVAGLTHTLGGMPVDPHGVVIPDTLYAAGCDARGTGAGGMASGLAQALVLGRAAGAAAARPIR